MTTFPAVPTEFSEWSAWWYKRLGARPESSEYLAGVSAWRNAFRPKRVRALLLAESHVAQHDGDARVRVRTDLTGLQGLPSQYVRLVYCLGYGESGICYPSPSQNSGTWQYWDILGQIARGENQPRKSAQRGGVVPSQLLRERLRWKLSILSQLRQGGIWLQDASPLGLYLGGGRRVDNRLYAELLRDAYNRWVWPSVEGDGPERVWTIGKRVLVSLAGFPGIDPERMIVQPQGDRDGLGRHREGLSRMCADLQGLCAGASTT